MKVKSYSSIRNVNNPWIPLVPSHWCVSPLKRHLISNDGGVWGSDPEDNEFTYVLRSTDQTVDGYWSIELPAQRYLTAKERQSATLEEGDLVVTKSSGSSKHIGKTTIVSSDMEKVGYCYGNFMQRLRTSTQLCSKYSWYVINSFICRQQLDVLSSTTTGLANLNGSLIGELVLPCPSKIEQQKIAQFLDYETAKIDALIDEQKRLIELLKEKRQAVISHAVTKGLNPDAPMKDSGVEWLGDVPEHWEVTKLGYLGDAIIGLTYSPDDIIDEGGTIVLRSTNIQNGQVSLHDNVHVSKKINEKLRLKIDDILICSRNGSRALIGKNALIGESAVGLTFGAFTTVFRSEYNSFLKYIFDSRIFSAQAGLFMTTTVNQLTTGTLNQMQIALPPVSEQNKIIEYLGAEVKRVEVLTAECELSLTLLQERRSALISAAVTGKIDVRDWQPPEDADLIDSNAAVQTERQDG